MQNGRKVSLFQMPPTDECQIIVLLKDINKNSNGTGWNMILEYLCRAISKGSVPPHFIAESSHQKVIEKLGY
jgi:hypothetical protein